MSAFVSVADFGQAKCGKQVEQFTILTASGVTVRLISLGATLTDWSVQNKLFSFSDVVLGFDDLAGYESDANHHYGCTTGRVANRIAAGKFSIEGTDYQVAVNCGPHHLHGGLEHALDKVVWQGEIVELDDTTGVRFTYLSPDGEEGFPGNLDLAVTYSLSEDCKLKIDYRATTDQATPVNLTNHSYFNLSGAGKGDAMDHILTLKSSNYTLGDAFCCPTGEIASVVGTPLDFTTPHAFSERIGELNDTPAAGYDHNFMLDHYDGTLREVALVEDPKSGMKMRMWTTESAVQLYTANHLGGEPGKQGLTYPGRSAFCLEAQAPPNAINEPSFPSVLLKPGETYRQTTVYQIGVGTRV